MKLAMKMIDKLVNFCDVKYVKFQKRNNRELLSKEKYTLQDISQTLQGTCI